MFFNGGFPGMGGGDPFGGQRRQQRKPTGPPEIKDEFYTSLGIEKTADEKAVKKAYRKLARKHHPDRPGGDAGKFKKISEAYDCLSDRKKRKLYDEYGKKGLEAGGNPNPDQSDLMSSLFGGGGGRRSQSSNSGPKKGKPTVHQLRLSLEDLYKGKKMRMKITRQIISKKGESTPVPLDEVESTFDVCSECRGRGAVVRMRQIGPGFMQQVQMKCPNCNGGASLRPGYRQLQKKETLTVEIPKGAKNNQKIKKEGKGDMKAGSLPSDIVFIVKQKNHSRFQRRGSDLLCEKEVSLLAALCGLKWRMKHLDGREVLISTEPGEILAGQEVMINSPSGEKTMYHDLKCVMDLGMPVPDTCDFGRLFVAFKVIFPEKGDLSPDQVTALEAVLGERKVPMAILGPDEDECFLEDADAASFGKSDEHARGAADESDEEEGGGRQGVQCAHQ